MKKYINISLYLYLPISCSQLGGGVPTQNRGYRGTRIYNLVVLNWYIIIPNQFYNTASSYTSASPISHAIATAASRVPVIFKPSFYPHHIETRIIGP